MLTYAFAFEVKSDPVNLSLDDPFGHTTQRSTFIRNVAGSA